VEVYFPLEMTKVDSGVAKIAASVAPAVLEDI